MAYDTQSAGRTSAFPIKMPYQEGSFHQPFERRTPMHCGWESRMGSHCIPFTKEDIKVFQRTGRLRRSVGMLIHVHTPCVCYGAKSGTCCNRCGSLSRSNSSPPKPRFTSLCGRTQKSSRLRNGAAITFLIVSSSRNENQARSYLSTRNLRWVAPAVSSVAMRSRWIGSFPR
jgi:hypothetical protein